MNERIYNEIQDVLLKKDNQRKEVEKVKLEKEIKEKNTYFDKVDRNTEKFYCKIWKEALKKYKRNGISSSEFNLSFKFQGFINEKYKFTLYRPILLFGTDMIDKEQLLQALNEDGIIFKTYASGNGNLVLKIHVTEESLRNVKLFKEKTYPEEKALKKTNKKGK